MSRFSRPLTIVYQGNVLLTKERNGIFFRAYHPDDPDHTFLVPARDCREVRK